MMMDQQQQHEQKATMNVDDSAIGLFVKKLVTREDPYHVHKCLGLLALAHCAWRFSLYYFDGDGEMGFVRYAAWTMPTLLLHVLLNVTSFVFVIHRRRIKAGGWRIWPE